MVVMSEPVEKRRFWQSFFGLFSPHENKENINVQLQDSHVCEMAHQEIIYAEILVQWIVTFLVMFLFLSFYTLVYMWKKTYRKPKTSTEKYKQFMGDDCGRQTLDDSDISNSSMSDIESDSLIRKEVKQNPVRLIFERNVAHGFSIFWKKTKTDFFLKQTVDKFLSELDKNIAVVSLLQENLNFLSSVLIDNQSVRESSETKLEKLSLAMRSSRMQMRKPVKSYRIGSDTPLESCELFWFETEAMKHRMAWSYKNYKPQLIDISDPELRIILQAFQSCTIDPGQLTCAIFIVNYVMLLIEKEISELESECGFRFVRFKLIGSMSKGTKISDASSFDFLMLLKCTKCCLDLAYHNGSFGDISPGNILITAHYVKPHFQGKKFLKKAHICDNIHQVFIPSETMLNASLLLDTALNNIMNRNKKIMDRIPFTLSRTTDAELTLVLNTRLLQGPGFGIPEIYIKLTPGVPLQFENSLLLPNIYAIVPPHLYNVKDNIFKQPEIFDINFAWKLSLCELEYLYLENWLQKIEETGIQSCLHICLESFKNLFSNNSSPTFVNSVEIKPYYLETIMFFLMLESSPSNWTFDVLPFRLSDAIHFLRTAVERQWLPNFFIGNPHLYKKSPIIKNIPLIDCSRQENLFSNMTSEMSRKTLLFIESRLIETGIVSCVKDEYSTDMWEYEFFVFG
ncbi:hypothetical protein LOTGIDRAFT_237671 [Lottia gigantea]|uniref:Mab-21-like HhH/H2TH-like domain-containing protein n=1 Tax=Lottia gigantea TaxID=225164 RepID=V4BBP8_LOTGI|nr:hypothetical protein LOTGIDRAFT_237671 [Lottia gigantea]ESP03482.1 hypothetical protein LOTGIDRAFT_237671 [Lottia gigantea]